jgi:hypothetical protein
VTEPTRPGAAPSALFDAVLSPGNLHDCLPSRAAHQVFKALKGRWTSLEAWGVREKLPHVRWQIAEWDSFGATGLRSAEDATRLRPAVAELELVERYAQERGYPAQQRIEVADWFALLVPRAADTEREHAAELE